MTLIPQLPPIELDYALVGRLRATVAERLADELGRLAGEGRRLGIDDQRMLGRQLIAEAVADHVAASARSGEPTPDSVMEDALARAVFAATFGLGRLGELLEDPAVENIDVVGCDDVWVSYADGRTVRGPAVAATDDDLIEMLRSFAAYHAAGGRVFSTAHPLLICGCQTGRGWPGGWQ